MFLIDVQGLQQIRWRQRKGQGGAGSAALVRRVILILVAQCLLTVPLLQLSAVLAKKVVVDFLVVLHQLVPFEPAHPDVILGHEGQARFLFVKSANVQLGDLFLNCA